MEMILDAFLSTFSESLVQMVTDEVGKLLGIPGQIEKLHGTVCDIQCVLADAERKQSNDRIIERWLKQLKDVMYDADDIIDLCEIKAEERKERRAGSSSNSSSNARCGIPLLSCFRNPFFSHEIVSKIKDINSRLEEIAKRRADLGLAHSQICPGPPDRVHRVDSFISNKKDPSILGDDIVGEKIEEDTEILVNWLTEEEKNVRENVRVVAIIGMGGIGKTTLATKIFNDPRIGDEFRLKIWVTVTKKVKGVEVLECVIRQAGEEPPNTNERSVLVPKLESLIKGKKIFLILDDVWEESQAVWHDLLRVPMSRGAHGSRLLITTRDERVANRMRATKSHRVEKLSNDDSWSLLIKQVLPNGNEIEIEDHRKIGMQIVEKCDGLPLAIKSIGGVLCAQGNSGENWLAVLRSNVWSMNDHPGDVHQAIYLSYEDLPPHLKQCFIFCSLFPEDFEFYKIDLIYRWLAEGFLQDKTDFWELGNKYYTELLQRNFFEDTDNYIGQGECKMHDILWSFAYQLGKEENCLLRGGQAVSRLEGSMKVRRLSMEGNEVNIELIKKEKGLRTLINFEPGIAFDDLCKAFSNLRTLDLSLSKSNLSSLPNSLCDLVHLRYLNVSNTKLVSISNSIGNLKKLVYFSCFGCEELSHVPSSIGKLRELRFLDFRGTKAKAIPMELNNLENLSHLFGFVPYKNKLERFSSLDGLEFLSKLIHLVLAGLERVSDWDIAERANLRSKNMLLELYLGYTSLSSKEQLSQTDEKKIVTENVLKKLCPPPSLNTVTIEGYFGRCLPNWLNLEADLPNLRNISIKDCACFKVLPMFGQLPNLHILHIQGAYSVEKVGEEFMQGDIKSKDPIVHTISGSARPAFPKLNDLLFNEMPNWNEWHWNEGQPAMPKLKKLFIVDCPQLRSLPKGLLLYATSLEFLQIIGADKLITVENIPSIKDILVLRNPNLTRILNLPSISRIRIENCPNLNDVMNPKALRTMVLRDYAMKFLPVYLTTIMTHKLTIWCSEELLRKIANQGKSGSEWHKFKHISKVKFVTWDDSLHATYQETPFSFTTNVDASSDETSSWHSYFFGQVQNSNASELRLYPHSHGHGHDSFQSPVVNTAPHLDPPVLGFGPGHVPPPVSVPTHQFPRNGASSSRVGTASSPIDLESGFAEFTPSPPIGEFVTSGELV